MLDPTKSEFACFPLPSLIRFEEDSRVLTQHSSPTGQPSSGFTRLVLYRVVENLIRKHFGRLKSGADFQSWESSSAVWKIIF